MRTEGFDEVLNDTEADYTRGCEEPPVWFWSYFTDEEKRNPNTLAKIKLALLRLKHACCVHPDGLERARVGLILLAGEIFAQRDALTKVTVKEASEGPQK